MAHLKTGVKFVCNCICQQEECTCPVTPHIKYMSMNSEHQTGSYIYSKPLSYMNGSQIIYDAVSIMVLKWGDPKIMRIFFLEGRGALVPPAPAWCVYVTTRRISWPHGVLEERSIWSV